MATTNKTTKTTRVSKLSTEEKQQYNNEKHFVLWMNDLCDTDKNQPAMRGEVTINGIKYKLSAWVRTANSGKAYIAGEVQPADAPLEGQSTEKTKALLNALKF